MASNGTVANVTAGKPAIGGAVHRAPLGTALPTSATAALGADFKALGYISEDGLTNSDSRDSESVKAWGGDTVLNVLTSREDTFRFTLIESLNMDVLKMVYGDDNVFGDKESGITIKANSNCDTEAVYVIDMILKDDVVKRIVIPDARVSEVGDISYKDAEATGYETTLTCMPDSDGNTHYEYIGG
jgi:hypothetical protein